MSRSPPNVGKGLESCNSLLKKESKLIKTDRKLFISQKVDQNDRQDTLVRRRGQGSQISRWYYIHNISFVIKRLSKRGRKTTAIHNSKTKVLTSSKPPMKLNLLGLTGKRGANKSSLPFSGTLSKQLNLLIYLQSKQDQYRQPVKY